MSTTPTAYSDVSGLRLTSILSQEAQLKLADRKSLWGHPAIFYAGDTSRTGTASIKVPIANLNGYDLMAAVSDGSAVSDTQLGNTSVTITVARQALSYVPTDLAKLTSSFSQDMVLQLVDSMYLSAAMRFQEMISGVTDDFATTVDNTGSALTVTNWFAAIADLEAAGNSGPYLANIHTKQLADLRSSTRGEAGAIQFRADAQDILSAKGVGITASFAGVDIMATTKIATAAGQKKGGMFAYGAIGYADGTPQPVLGAGADGVFYPAGTKVYVELQRDAQSAITRVVGNYYVGVSILQDAKGVTLISVA